MYNESNQLLPLITPEMLRSMPDQTCDILNRLIRFYQDYQKSSSNAITTNTSNIEALATQVGDIVIPTVNNGQLTIQKNGQTVGTFTANQAGNTTANIEVPDAPTVNNGTLTIRQNGTSVGTFTANQSRDTTVDISTSSDSSILEKAYPVGAIYMSTNNVSPANFIGGTWERIQDRFLLAAGNTYSAGSTGGEATHTLTINEMPSHRHTDRSYVPWERGGTSVEGTSSTGYRWHSNGASAADTGGGQAHNNMPPYYTVYMWRRTA